MGENHVNGNEEVDMEMLVTYSTGILAVCLANSYEPAETGIYHRLLDNLTRRLRVRLLGDNDEGALFAALTDTGTTVDAASAVFLTSSRSSSNASDDGPDHLEAIVQESDEDFDEVIKDRRSLEILRDKFSIQCLVILQEYSALNDENWVDLCFALLKRSLCDGASSTTLLPDILKLISELVAYQEFASLFVDRDGMLRLLSVPQSAKTFKGLSLALVKIGSIQRVMQRISTNVVRDFVELSVQLIQCPENQAKKNAVLFFTANFAFRTVIDVLDTVNGFPKLLSLLDLRGTSLENEIAYHTCVAVCKYFRAHLIVLVDSLRPMEDTRTCYEGAAANTPLDLSNAALDTVFHQIYMDRNIGSAFTSTQWLVLDGFFNSNRHITMLEFTAAPLDESITAIAYALGVLDIVSLFPYSLKRIVSATLKDGRGCVAVILDAVVPYANEFEITALALHLLINLVWPSAEEIEDVYQRARGDVRSRNGIKILLSLLLLKPGSSSDHGGVSVHRMHALTCRVLQGLAKDDDIARIFEYLQVAKTLSQLIQETKSQISADGPNRWQAELMQVGIELIGVINNNGQAATSRKETSNVATRLRFRESMMTHRDINFRRKDLRFSFSRFRPWRTCNGPLFTCMTFLRDPSRVAAVGGIDGEIRVLDFANNNVLESYNTSHLSPVTRLESRILDDSRLLLLSSARKNVLLWDGDFVSGGPKHSFDGVRSARFNNRGDRFAALKQDPSTSEIQLYDVSTCKLNARIKPARPDDMYSFVHFSPSDEVMLYGGSLWDCRSPTTPLHQFEKLTDYGGGGFHPAGNEVVINSEVWDLRNYRLVNSTRSLDKTEITFNNGGDIIYAILRGWSLYLKPSVLSATYLINTLNQRLRDPRYLTQAARKHPLLSAFRTVDAVGYSEIATIPVDGGGRVIDLAIEPTNQFVGLVAIEGEESSARVYEIGGINHAAADGDDDDSDP